MRKAGCFLLLFCLFFGSCTAKRTTAEKMEDFAAAYGNVGTVYASSAKVGTAGYIDEDFTVALFGRVPGGLSEYAVFLGENPECAEECCALVAQTYGDALDLYQAALERISLVLKVENQNGRQPEYFIKQYGKTVVYGVFSEKDRAVRILEKLF